MTHANLHTQKIWHVVNLIPKGYVAGYGQVADLAGLPGRARLVGKCLGQASEATSINWHRVLRSNGQIAFPDGSTAAAQQAALLISEGVIVRNHRVSMKQYQWQPDLGELLAQLIY